MAQERKYDHSTSRKAECDAMIAREGRKTTYLIEDGFMH